MPRPPFPRNLADFQRQFTTDEACQEYLAMGRWPEGFPCPRCRHQHAYPLTTRRHWECTACRHQVSLTSGTILQNTKIPLTVWF